ncbi:MAG: DUF2284 domain-containing protein [Candidatus Thorarchaeota archaeon]
MKYEDLTEVKAIEINRNSIITTNQIFCNRSYKNHPNGCPNYNNNDLCPPKSLEYHFNKINNNYNYFYIIYIYFNFKGYLEIKEKDWIERNIKITEDKLRNLYHWQNKIKSILKSKMKEIVLNNYFNKKIYIISCGSGFKDKFLNSIQNKIYSMEAIGINVFSTMKLNGLRMEILPENKLYLVGMLCSDKPLNIEIEDKQKEMF